MALRKAGLFFCVALASLLTGCVSRSEVAYDGQRMESVTVIHDGNPALLEALKDAPDPYLAENREEPLVLDGVSETGDLKALIISQKVLERGDLVYDGKQYTVLRDMTVRSQDGEVLGGVKEGDEVTVIYFIGDMAVFFVGSEYGFIEAGGLADSSGKQLALAPLEGRPVITAQEDGGGHILLGNQNSLALSGEKIELLIIDASVSAVVEIRMDFDRLVVENAGTVLLEDCRGGVVENIGGASITVGSNAVISDMEIGR